MSKVDIKRLDSVTKNDTTATEQINDNFQALQAAIENTVSRDGTVPNYMDADFDLNSYRIINAGDPVEERDVVTLKYFEEKAGGAIEAAAEAKVSASRAASSAQSALVASNNAIGQLAQAEGLLTAAEVQLEDTKQYIDAAKSDIDSTVTQAKADVNTAVSTAESNISSIVSDAEGSITNIAVTEANKAIANAAQEATDMATANVNSYVDGTVKQSLQTYVDQAQEDANSAATSMEQAALSATAASNYASNASADADNAAESAGLAANSAGNASASENNAKIWADGTDSEVQALGGVHSSKGWSEIAKDSLPSQAGNDGKFLTTDGTEASWADVGGGLEIGDIGFAPLGVDETENKRRYLNGQVISQAQFVSFTAMLKSRVSVYPSLATTETNWQAEVTDSVNGTCGKFVIDDEAGTIRLPKYPEYVSKEYIEAAVVGNGMALGLTDGTSNAGLTQIAISGVSAASPKVDAYGTSISTSISGAAGLIAGSIGITTDPTKSGIVANLANATTETIPCKWFIQVATGVEESVDVTREIELNNPFSLLDYKWSEYEITNASWLLSSGAFHSGSTYVAVYELLLKIYNGTETKEGVSVKLSTESYTDTDFVINTTDTTFRLPIKVKLASGKSVVGNDSDMYFHSTANASDGTMWVGGRNVQGTNWNGGFVQVNGQLNSNSGENRIRLTTDPTKSGMETSSSGLKLYFYVGETIQDANIINASGVLTRVDELSNEYIVGLGMPDYSAGVSLTFETNYTCPSAGFIFMAVNSYQRSYSITINGNVVTYNLLGGNSAGVDVATVLVSKNDVVLLSGGNNERHATFYPMKGVN